MTVFGWQGRRGRYGDWIVKRWSSSDYFVWLKCQSDWNVQVRFDTNAELWFISPSYIWVTLNSHNQGPLIISGKKIFFFSTSTKNFKIFIWNVSTTIIFFLAHFTCSGLCEVIYFVVLLLKLLFFVRFYHPSRKKMLWTCCVLQQTLGRQCFWHYLQYVLKL